jgi:argininosuccinate synthase
VADKVVLGYSGGLDTSVCVLWLKERYGLDVVTVTLDVGQGEDMKAIEEKAMWLGAVKHYAIEAKEEFASGYITRAIWANALYQGKYPLGTALARPLIAAKLVEVAHKEGAAAVAHGCTGKGNDQVRFDVTIKALDPQLRIIAPVREWGMTRDKEAEYAASRGYPMEPKRSAYSVDQNLWGRSVEGGELEDLWLEPPEEALEWCVPAQRAPDEPEYLELAFEEGLPVSLNGERMGLARLIEELNSLAGKHGVGLIDHVEDRVVGIKSREVYEYPAATCIIEAHRDLEKAVLTRQQLEFKQLAEGRWSWLVYAGLWMEPLREDLERFMRSTQSYVEGKVKLKLYKGGLRVVGRSSPFSLYSHGLATYGAPSTFDQSAAKGFIELWGLQARLSWQRASGPRNVAVSAEKGAE